MNAIIQIHGREAIPVRALPWLTAWEFSAQEVAEALAHDNGYESFDGMEAYRLENGAIQTVRVGEWLNSVAISIEEIAERELPRTEWEKLAMAALPAGVFVWRDEWEAAYNRSPDGPDSLDALGDAADEEDVAKRTLHFAPHVPPELVNLVMQGFTQLGALASEQTTAAPVPVAAYSASDAPVVAETVAQRRARWLDMFEAEEKREKRGALQRLADSENVDRSNMRKDIEKARGARDTERRAGTWTSQLVQGGKRPR